MAKIPLLAVMIVEFGLVIGSAVGGSEKRGLAVGHRNFLCDDLKTFPGVSWW